MADATTYLTRDEFANFKNYTSFATFSNDNDFPSQSTLNIMRKRMYAIINTFIGSAVSIDDFLMGLEYQGVKMMIVEAEAEIAGEPRDFYMPHDYLYERDRRLLDAYDSQLNRGVTSG